MEALTCNMCGGKILLSADQTIGTCTYCGTRVVLSKFNRKKRVAAMNRANEFRARGDFDTALSIYEQIVAEDDTDAEAHWCCALCRFGIEYVQDPATLEYLPTCHRLSTDSFLEDVDYKAAIANCKGISLFHYQVEGAKIAGIQRDILPISRNEQPFDIFLCCKELDQLGHRSEDSVLAQDIYYRLTDCGFRVFFARITLKDKPGEKFEPYIFSALNSAKIMILIGTSPEHITAPWVKNEWSRYLNLAKRSPRKRIIPCYKGMSPTEMPEPLKSLQSYDIGEISFLQDLLYGIRKIFPEQPAPAVQQAQPQTAPVQIVGNPVNTENLLMRVKFFLEDRDWASADSYCDKALDADPQCADAYFYKMLSAFFLSPDRLPILARWLERFSPRLTQAEVECVTQEHALFFWKLYQQAQLPKRLDALLDLYPLLATHQISTEECPDTSLLNESIRSGNTLAAELLLRHGASPNDAYRRWSLGQENYTCSPLSEAVQAQDGTELLSLLLEQGADPALTDAVLTGEDTLVPQNIFQQAVSFRKPKALAALLEWQEAQYAQKELAPPMAPLCFLLRMAVSLDFPDVAAVLLEHQADPNQAFRTEGEANFSLLSDAIRDGSSTELITILLDHGADPNICDTRPAKNGQESLPALHQAVLRQKPELISLLLDHGASWSTPYSEGRKSVPLGRFPYYMNKEFSPEYLSQLEALGWKHSMRSAFTLSSILKKQVKQLVDIINE